MIPKMIHYCWFGKGNKPKLALACIESWKKYCPEYELVEWNEENFDIACNLYVKQAYAHKKFAFVADYARFYALYHYGGIYMDTDVELVKSLDIFLMQKAFSGFELPEYVSAGIMACEKDFILFKEFLDYYEDKAFVDRNGGLNMITIVATITSIFEKYGLRKDGTYQIIRQCTLYPIDYFYPLSDATGRLRKTENTYAIHWFSKSWIEPKYRLRSKITRIFHRIFGEKCFAWLKTSQ